MGNMLEESVEGFIIQWKTYAASVELFARPEGSPLIECLAGERVLHVFERTNPYISVTGRTQLIINPVAERIEKSDQTDKLVSVTGLSALRATGVVLQRWGKMVVVDAGIPLVVGVHEGLPDDVAAGDWLSFQSLAPIHGFVVPMSAPLSANRLDERDGI